MAQPDPPRNLQELPADLPAPADDGACDHLAGAAVPSVALPATTGGMVDMSALPGRSVVYVYPYTGRPSEPMLVPHWNEIPGARGCTPQTCGYRDLAAEFAALGCRVFGLSTQSPAEQAEMAARLAVPYPVLSDAELQLTAAWRLPTFVAAGRTLLKRMAWVLRDGRMERLFYPVFPPNECAARTLRWVSVNP